MEAHGLNVIFSIFPTTTKRLVEVELTTSPAELQHR